MEKRQQTNPFSQNMASIRSNGRFSYQKFSEKLKIGKSTLQAIESGRDNITLGTLFVIADGLQIHPALLLTELPQETDLTIPKLYTNIVINYLALPGEKQADFRTLLQQLEDRPFVLSGLTSNEVK